MNLDPQAIKRKIDEDLAQVNKNKEDLKKVETNLKNKNSEIDKIETEEKRLSQEVSKLQGDLQKKEQELSLLKPKLANLKNEALTISGQKDKFNADNSRIENELRNQQQLLDSTLHEIERNTKK